MDWLGEEIYLQLYLPMETELGGHPYPPLILNPSFFLACQTQ